MSFVSGVSMACGMAESAQVASTAEGRNHPKPDVPDVTLEARDGAKATPEPQQLAMMLACVESMPGAIVSFRLSPDGKGSFPYASVNFEDIFGCPREEVVADASMVSGRIHADDAARVKAAITESATGLARLHEEYRYLHPSKGTVWIEVQSTPTREPGGAVVWHGYVRDVTARKRAEEELRHSEARRHALFDVNLIGVCYADARNATINEANDKFLEMLGFDREDLEAGRINWRELTPPEYRAANEAAIAELLKTGRNERPTEKEYLRKDGGRLPVLVGRALLDRDSTDGVAFVLDNSEQKKNEARLREAHRDRLAIMRSMAFAIAHEINQPLAATATYLRVVQRLLRMTPDERPSSVDEAIDRAVAQTTRAHEIVSRLRFISQEEPDKVRLGLHELIIEAVEATNAAVSERKVAVTLQLNASPDNTVLADKIQIRHVLTDLISNALEAMELTDERRLSITTQSSEKEIRVDVVDTGIGLREDRKSALFLPFATTKANSMGIGLAISREIIEAHHGRIWGESRLGGGAIFSFTLPLVEDEVE